MTQTDKKVQSQQPEEGETVTHSPNERGKWVTLIWVSALMVVGIFGCMSYSHLPRANDAQSNAIDTQLTPTPTATGLVDSIQLNKSVTVNDTQVTVNQVQQATGFSDVKKKAGNYTVRVYVTIKNVGKQVSGPQYDKVLHLKLADGTTVAPSFISASPTLVPGTYQNGSFDFGVSSPVTLSDLTLLIEDKSLSFSNK
ncbi:hypothetical protein [Ktedonobacter racemifer]|uniref:DUF4352 domain-containing protein n=1 Tax=Ktedonobacter racemifer DSM 44963 TaxID=485913 RepID=D6TJI5_KTERA|nr:hypothetical protein [Ktedonobacter racemifer]EFH89592.1 hypothetical protein Krac_11157 [Ktedonobacter racemifer DSM 44963]